MTAPRAIVDRLELVIGVDGAPQRLMTVIEVELTNHFGFLPIRATEKAEQVVNSVARLIAERAAVADESGTVAILTLLGVTSDSVAGCCHVLPSDPAAVAAAKQRRIKAAELLEAIKALSFDEFEKLGARVLSEIGASFVRITPHSNDQGIDFYGRLSLGQFQQAPSPFLKLAHDVVLLFAGQAKHYPNRPLGPDVVRELIGAVSLARTKTFSKVDADFFPELNLKPFSPLVTLLLTTGTITAGAAQLAETAGIIARSGLQISVFLADKGVGMVTVQQEIRFDQQKFFDWLNS